MSDLLPKMIIRKSTKSEAPVVKIEKENLEENIVFDKKTTPKKQEQEPPPQEEEEDHEEIEQEIKELENEIEELEKPPTPPPTPRPTPEPIPDPEPPERPLGRTAVGANAPPVVQTIKGKKKVDKRKGCSEARKEHLARIREKALIARRKKAEEKKKAKEEASKPPPQPIYNHNISAIEIENAVSKALELSEQKRLERKAIKKKKKEEEAELQRQQQELELKKKRIYNAVNIPPNNPWEFCFR